ncbi:hypothetical protein NMY22_g3843 [Coprinellus aureogranulatus]|nr:hypothetical protein NMY22_g3843 [Coprinellus aureogranulatus]
MHELSTALWRTRTAMEFEYFTVKHRPHEVAMRIPKREPGSPEPQKGVNNPVVVPPGIVMAEIGTSGPGATTSAAETEQAWGAAISETADGDFPSRKPFSLRSHHLPGSGLSERCVEASSASQLILLRTMTL